MTYLRLAESVLDLRCEVVLVKTELNEMVYSQELALRIDLVYSCHCILFEVPLDLLDWLIIEQLHQHLEITSTDQTIVVYLYHMRSKETYIDS